MADTKEPPEATAERLRKWSQTDLAHAPPTLLEELKRDAALAAECIDGLMTDIDQLCESFDREMDARDERWADAHGEQP